VGQNYVEMEVVALQQLQNLPQLTGTGKSNDENREGVVRWREKV